MPSMADKTIYEYEIPRRSHPKPLKKKSGSPKPKSLSFNKQTLYECTKSKPLQKIPTKEKVNNSKTSKDVMSWLSGPRKPSPNRSPSKSPTRPKPSSPRRSPICMSVERSIQKLIDEALGEAVAGQRKNYERPKTNKQLNACRSKVSSRSFHTKSSKSLYDTYDIVENEREITSVEYLMRKISILSREFNGCIKDEISDGSCSKFVPKQTNTGRVKAVIKLPGVETIPSPLKERKSKITSESTSNVNDKKIKPSISKKIIKEIHSAIPIKPKTSSIKCLLKVKPERVKDSALMRESRNNGQQTSDLKKIKKPRVIKESKLADRNKIEIKTQTEKKLSSKKEKGRNTKNDEIAQMLMQVNIKLMASQTEALANSVLEQIDEQSNENLSRRSSQTNKFQNELNGTDVYKSRTSEVVKDLMIIPSTTTSRQEDSDDLCSSCEVLEAIKETCNASSMPTSATVFTPSVVMPKKCLKKMELLEQLINKTLETSSSHNSGTSEVEEMSPHFSSANCIKPPTETMFTSECNLVDDNKAGEHLIKGVKMIDLKNINEIEREIEPEVTDEGDEGDEVFRSMEHSIHALEEQRKFIKLLTTQIEDETSERSLNVSKSNVSLIKKESSQIIEVVDLDKKIIEVDNLDKEIIELDNFDKEMQPIRASIQDLKSKILDLRTIASKGNPRESSISEKLDELKITTVETAIIEQTNLPTEHGEDIAITSNFHESNVKITEENLPRQEDAIKEKTESSSVATIEKVLHNEYKKQQEANNTLEFSSTSIFSITNDLNRMPREGQRKLDKPFSLNWSGDKKVKVSDDFSSFLASPAHSMLKKLVDTATLTEINQATSSVLVSAVRQRAKFHKTFVKRRPTSPSYYVRLLAKNHRQKMANEVSLTDVLKLISYKDDGVDLYNLIHSNEKVLSPNQTDELLLIDNLDSNKDQAVPECTPVDTCEWEYSYSSDVTQHLQTFETPLPQCQKATSVSKTSSPKSPSLSLKSNSYPNDQWVMAGTGANAWNNSMFKDTTTSVEASYTDFSQKVPKFVSNDYDVERRALIRKQNAINSIYGLTRNRSRTSTESLLHPTFVNTISAPKNAKTCTSFYDNGNAFRYANPNMPIMY